MIHFLIASLVITFLGALLTCYYLPNILFLNSFSFPSYANITRSFLTWFHGILLLSSVFNCMCLVNCSMSLISSCPYQFQSLARADAQNVHLSHEHMLQHTVWSLANITQSVVAYLHCSCVNLSNEHLSACYLRFVHFLLHAAREKEVQWCQTRGFG